MESFEDKVQEDNAEILLSPSSTSRYGRALRPKISEDFYSMDAVVIEKPRKSPSKSSPVKSPIVLDNIKDECNKFEDLGAKVANNFKANLQRGLADTIKERKFFKSATESKEEVSNVVDVNKVLKLISPKQPEIKEIFDTKPTHTKSVLKTYGNKRKRFEDGDDVKIESFGLPDEPIIPVKPRKLPRINKKIDLTTNENIDVNLEHPWRMDECQSGPNNEYINDNMCNKVTENCANTVPTQSEVMGKQEVKTEVEYEIGDLVWAKIGTYPFWPCMITEEPTAGQYYKYINRHIKPTYHVRFFGDNGRRSWVTGTHIIPYTNKDDLERLATKHTNERTLSKTQIKESYRIRTKIKKTWTIAVDEAELVKPKTVEERNEYFSQVIATSLKRKRRSIDDIIKEHLDKVEVKNEQNIENETKETTTKPLKTMRKKSVDLTEENIEARKKLRSSNVFIKQDTLDDDDNTSIKKEPIDLEEQKENVENVDLPPPAKKIKRNSTDGHDSDKKTIQLESNSDTDSKFSDNSSVPTSLESQAALHKRNNIFRGVPRDKVCQICEKSGDILKCKGPCGGVYHHSCAFSTPVPDAASDAKSNVEIIAIEPKDVAPIPQLSPSADLMKGMSLAEKIDFRMKEIMKNCDQSLYSDYSSEVVEEVQPVKPIIPKPTRKVPIIKHVTADDINYVCIEKQEEEEKPMEVDVKTIKDFKCGSCLSNKDPVCQVCFQEVSRTGSQVRQKCSFNRCDKYYHHECLKVWPQTQWSLSHNEHKLETFMCPRHLCHTCASDDPRAPSSRCYSDKVVKCLRCPATYHSSNYCVPAGTDILTASQIICPRHFYEEKSGKKKNFQYTINANWCFICSKGGNLVCCETCPTSVHSECISGSFNEADRFYCEDCQSGRLPLYDEIVWVKLGKFRWWPALILFPNEVPERVKNISHNKGEFVVKFFGTYDHYWVGRGRTFLFQEGDQGHPNSLKKRVDNAFVKAIEEATAAYMLKREFKVSKVAERPSFVKPPHYIRIKANKPVGNVRLFDGNTSNTTSCDCDPNESHPCGPDTNCLNRLLLTECNPEMCPAGQRCNNQRFEKREYPPMTPYRTDGRGWGLKTLAPIRKGQFVIEYVGEMINEREYQRRIKRMNEQKEENYYFLTIDKDRMLDAGPKGNVARFMNHSCQPNCETQKWTVNGITRVGLFATCDIPADTELTFNYNLECIGKEKKICKCQAPNCSGFIGVKVKGEELPKKTKKIISKQKKKKSPVPVFEVINDNPCFICGKLGEVGACNNKICTKYYHLECLGMTAWPEGGKWACPWHNCNLCSKRTIRCCVKCINSYCPPHSEGNVRYDKLLGFVCTDHDPSKESPIEDGNNLSEAVSQSVDDTEINDEATVTSTTEDVSVVKLDNDCVTSTPIKNNNDDKAIDRVEDVDSTPIQHNDDESTVSSVSISESNTVATTTSSKKKTNKKKKQTTANIKLTEEEKELFVPVRVTRKSNFELLNKTDPEKDLPIRKRTRLRCGNNSIN